jgi:hypothetical protein
MTIEEQEKFKDELEKARKQVMDSLDRYNELVEEYLKDKATK